MTHEQADNNEAMTREKLGIGDGIPLQVSDGGIEALRRDIQHLMDIEAIKQLKHAYFRCIDTANFDELGSLLHESVLVDFVGGSYAWQLQGRQAYVDAVRGAFHRQAIGHHNGHSPEIQLLGDDEATGVWYLADQMWMLNYRHYTAGTALYSDRYVKVDGRWLIAETRYRRLYEIQRQLDENPPLSAHYLGEHGKQLGSDSN